MENEEIKEILDYIDDRIIPNEKWDKIKDYITNLQQKDFESQKEITKLKDKLEQQRKEYQDTYKDVRIEIKEKNERITNLQQKLQLANDTLDTHNELIEKLYQENERLEENNQAMQEEMARTWKITDDYKSRCEKAIEYIRTNLIIEWDIENDGNVSGSDLPADAIAPILNILNGSDKK